MPEESIYKVNEEEKEGGYTLQEQLANKKRGKVLRDEALRALLYNHYQQVIKDQRKYEGLDVADEDFSAIENVV